MITLILIFAIAVIELIHNLKTNKMLADLLNAVASCSTVADDINAKVETLKTNLAAAQLPAGALSAADVQQVQDAINALQTKLSAVSTAAA
jgi:hypothetical protein